MSAKMPVHFFDTSAITKHYHAETGTAKVDSLLDAPCPTALRGHVSTACLRQVRCPMVWARFCPSHAHAKPWAWHPAMEHLVRPGRSGYNDAIDIIKEFRAI